MQSFGPSPIGARVNTSPDLSELPPKVHDLLKRSTVSLSIAQVTLPDCPLIAVNDRFCAMTGYRQDEVLHKNCRFLQPPGGAGPVRDRMRAFIPDHAQEQARFVVPNIRRNGEPFLNLIYMSKLRRRGEIVYILGSQFDVSRYTRDRLDAYDQALHRDIHQLSFAVQESELVLMGTIAQLASSHSIIAQLRLDE